MFVDAVSLLHSIDASYVDPDRAVAMEAAHLKAQYDSQLEMKIASSFGLATRRLCFVTLPAPRRVQQWLKEVWGQAWQRLTSGMHGME